MAAVRNFEVISGELDGKYVYMYVTVLHNNNNNNDDDDDNKYISYTYDLKYTA
jgi:hypothetical protein